MFGVFYSSVCTSKAVFGTFAAPVWPATDAAGACMQAVAGSPMVRMAIQQAEAHHDAPLLVVLGVW